MHCQETESLPLPILFLKFLFWDESHVSPAAALSAPIAIQRLQPGAVRSKPAVSYTSRRPNVRSFLTIGSEPGTTCLFPGAIFSAWSIPTLRTRAASIRSSSVVVHAPMKQPSNFMSRLSLTGTTLSGDGYSAMNGSICAMSMSKVSAYSASASARKYKDDDLLPLRARLWIYG